MIGPSPATCEHLGWCAARGMTPNEVCESVGAFLTDPTWTDAAEVIEARASQLRRGAAISLISDRSAA